MLPFCPHGGRRDAKARKSLTLLAHLWRRNVRACCEAMRSRGISSFSRNQGTHVFDKQVDVGDARKPSVESDETRHLSRHAAVSGVRARVQREIGRR